MNFSNLSTHESLNIELYVSDIIAQSCHRLNEWILYCSLMMFLFLVYRQSLKLNFWNIQKNFNLPPAFHGFSIHLFDILEHLAWFSSMFIIGLFYYQHGLNIPSLVVLFFVGVLLVLNVLFSWLKT